MSAIVHPHLVYQLTRSNKSWCYKLVPVNFNGRLSKEFEDGTTCSGSEAELLRCVPELGAYLSASMHRLHEQGDLRPLSLSFSDELILRRPDREDLYKAVVDIPVDSVSHTDLAWAAYVLFSSLYLCCLATPESTRMVLVYAAWQRYNLIKALYREAYTATEAPEKAITEYDLLDNEFASSYRALAGLLLDEANSYACRILWKEGSPKRARDAGAKQSSWSTLRSTLSKTWKPHKAPDVQIRQDLRLSMFLSEPSDGLPTGVSSYISPLPAPRCFRRHAPVSGNTELHPRFQEETGQAAVRRFISEELLPQYDLASAVALAARVPRFALRYRPRRWLVKLSQCGTSWTVLTIFVFSLFLLMSCSLNSQWFSWTQAGLPYAVFASSLLLLIVAAIGTGLENGIALMLPRVTGGIAIGYFPLLVATEPWYLALYTSQHHPAWLLEWIAILLLAGGYLFREARGPVLRHGEALVRSVKVLMWASVQAVLIGFALILLSGPVYRQLEDSIHYKTPAALNKMPLANGLSYYVNVPGVHADFPISALLTFAPLSLLLGITLQILWEEKPITASVWPSESR